MEFHVQDDLHGQDVSCGSDGHDMVSWDHSNNTWVLTRTHRDVASMGHGDQYRPTADGMVPHMLIWPSDHDGTTRCLICYNFSKFVLADRRAHFNHLQCIRLMHVKMICKMWLTGLTRVSTCLANI